MDNKTEERLLNVFSEASGKSAGGAHASDAEEAPATEDRSHADSAAEYTSAPAEASSFDGSLDGGARPELSRNVRIGQLQQQQ